MFLPHNQAKQGSALSASPSSLLRFSALQEVIAQVRLRRLCYPQNEVRNFLQPSLNHLENMANLDSLPAELIHEIAEKLQGSFYNGTLVSLGLVSKRFHDIVEPVLYRSIYVSTVYCNTPHDISPLIHTLYTRPDLAAKVRRITFQPGLSTDPSDNPWVEDSDEINRLLSLEEQTLARSECYWATPMLWEAGLLGHLLSLFPGPNAGDDDKERFIELFRQWIGGMLAENTNAFSGLLLSLTPNIQDLDISLYDTCWAWAPAQYPLSALYGLPKTRQGISANSFMADVALLSPLMRGIRGVRTLWTAGGNLSFLNLPFDRLTHLELYLEYFTGSDSWNEVDLQGVFQTYPTLESLTIIADWADVCDERRGSMIMGLIHRLRCHNLKAFRFSVGNSGGNTYSNYSIPSFRGLALDIESTATTLEHLEIDVFWRPNFHPDYKYFAPVCSLKHFTALKKLDVAQVVLLPRDYPKRRVPVNLYPVPLLEIEHRLPSTLEELVIRSPSRNIVRVPGRIVEKSSYFPKLKRVSFICRLSWGVHGRFFRRSHPVIEALERHGIQVHIEHTEEGIWGYKRDLLERDEPGPNLWSEDWTDGDWTTLVFEADL